MLREICRHRLASATIRSVALRFQDQWSRSVQGMRVNESGRDDKSSRNRLNAFPQKPNTRTGDQSGCGDERLKGVVALPTTRPSGSMSSAFAPVVDRSIPSRSVIRDVPL